MGRHNRKVIWQPHPGPQTKFLASSCYEVMYGGQAGGGKRLRIDEPIPTPEGWTTMGDLQVGDFVLDADGQAVRVNWCSEVEHNPDAWELEFSDGFRIECDSEHQWITLTATDRDRLLRASPEWRTKRRAGRPSRASGKKTSAFREALAKANSARARTTSEVPPARGYTRTTAEIVASLTVGKRINHSVENPSPLELPEADLPLDPYVLGAWLGDGSRASAKIHGIDPQILNEVEAAGFRVTAYSRTEHGIAGLGKPLRAAGVWANKHIPQAYLRASVRQRLALLQGLCDTDGHATDKGSIEFTTTSVALRDGMVELLASLGIKPSCREGIATLKGRDISAKWRIQFWTELPSFRLDRKAQRQKTSGFRGLHGRRYIVAARRVPPTPMRCIGVDSQTHSYLAGLPMVVTHNSESLIVGPLRYVHHPRFRAILFRNTFDDVVRSLGERSELLYPVVFPGAQYNRSDHTWTFPSGAKIYLRYLSSDHDALDHKSQEYQYIGFDELTTFTRHQYTYMLSRLRSSHGIPVQVRSGTNPGDRGHEWVFERFAAWLDPKHPNPAEPGEVRHYARVGDKTEEVPRGTVGARGRTFIRAALKDNPSLSVDYGYQLDDLDPVTRAQLKDGDWLVKPGRGKYFKREWVTVLSERPRDIVSTVRYWDFAGTSQKTEKHDPDWTAGVKMSMCSSGMVLVEHCDRYRGEPAEVEARTLQCAQLDGHIVRIGLEQDPGQAGKFQMRHFSRMLMGYTANAFPPTGDKVQRFGPFSAQAANGNVAVMQGEWTQEWLAELEQFPEGSHDDQVDATSGAFMMLQENRNSMMDLLMRMTAE